MPGYRFASAVDTARRTILAFGLATPILFSTLGPPAPASAELTIPDARLQVIVRGVHIYNDRDDYSEGELSLTVSLVRCPQAPAPCGYKEGQQERQDLTFLNGAHKSFDANDGDTVRLDWVLPAAAEPIFLNGASDGTSYLVSGAERYLLLFSMWDDDGGGDSDFAGRVSVPLEKANGWHLGAYKERALYERGGTTQTNTFDVEYEVRRTPLPNLRPTTIKVFDGSGALADVCLGVVNDGPEPAGLFQIFLYLNGITNRLGTVDVAVLTAGESRDACIRANLPSTGQHQLIVVVDEDRAVPEMDEHDNWISQALDRTVAGSTRPQPGARPGDVGNSPGTGSGGGSGPTAPPTPMPTPTPNPALPDLLVSALRINGRAPDGKDDCKDGKNAVTVVVKNGGTANAGPFAVQLAVGKDLVADRSVPGLDAGKQREIRLDDVRLANGEHRLAATADSNEAVAESNEGNNTLAVTARCKDDD